MCMIVAGSSRLEVLMAMDIWHGKEKGKSLIQTQVRFRRVKVSGCYGACARRDELFMGKHFFWRLGWLVSADGLQMYALRRVAMLVNHQARGAGGMSSSVHRA